MTIRPLSPALSGLSWSWNPQVRTSFRFPVSRFWPGLKVPTELMAGQSVWSGCGSDDIAWGRESLLTKSTRVPGGTVNSFGLTPADVIVKVNGLVGTGAGDEGDEPPPQDSIGSRHDIAA